MIETLYRKYRPKQFSDIIGQDKAVSVLQSFVASENPPQSIILKGTRGIGKTTLARIVASELNIDPIDIFELDAASNNGVDEMRNLIQESYSMPVMSHKKVYIFDEVHMFSTSTWSVLLKALEEPPQHVVFIMATTDDHKIPDTIISRSSIVALATPNRESIAQLIDKTSKSEGLELDQDAVDLLVVAADGSFRNALVALETVMRSSADQQITSELVSKTLSLPPLSYARTLVQHIAYPSQEISDSILEVEQYDATILMRMVVERVRMCMELRFKIITTVPETDRELVEKIAKDISGSQVNAKTFYNLLRLETDVALSENGAMLVQAYLFGLLEGVK